MQQEEVGEGRVGDWQAQTDNTPKAIPSGNRGSERTSWLLVCPFHRLGVNRLKSSIQSSLPHNSVSPGVSGGQAPFQAARATRGLRPTQGTIYKTFSVDLWTSGAVSPESRGRPLQMRGRCYACTERQLHRFVSTMGTQERHAVIPKGEVKRGD